MIDKRGYIDDEEMGLYYLRSRYYNPTYNRFVNEDACDSLGKDDTLVGYNQYAYCKNNPIRMYDPTGRWSWGWDDLLDLAVSAVTAVASVVVGVAVGVAVATTAPFVAPIAVVAGVAAGVATNGVVNNTVNAVYYEYSDGESSINGGSYNDDYISRWERLDYAKQQTGEEHYSVNAWRYHSEYSVHMYGWYMLRGHKGEETKLGEYADSLESADVDPAMWDNRKIVKYGTIGVGILGW